MARSAVARVADEALARRAEEGALCATVGLAEWCERWGVSPAQFLREVASAEYEGEIRVTAIEVEAPAE